MSPVRIQPTEQQQNSEFAQLFEESMKQVSLKEGEIVKGKIVGTTRDFVMVDIGFKSEGQVPIHEFTSIRGEITAPIGEIIEVFIEAVEDDQGNLALSKERAVGMRTWDLLEKIEAENGDIQGTVVAKVKGGLSVDIGVRAFLPGSQIDLRPMKNLDQYLGQKYLFKIIKLNKRRGNVVLSRKAILEKERAALKQSTLENLSEGQIFNGIVKNVTDYGLFIDLGGIDGLLHITDMSWGRINHPSDVYKVGDEIRVVILKFDREGQKVSLGLKQLQPDPWQNVEEKFVVGSRVHGKVVSLTDYGAFVSLDDGVEGLIHISEMSWSKKIKHPSKILHPNEEVDAVVLDVDTEAKRISLGLKQILPNPWQEIEKKYSIGNKVKGTVRNIADFGIFVDVGEEIDGLIHISDLTWVQNFAHPSEVFKKGDEVEAIVMQIDADNERFSLGLKQLLDDPWDHINSRFHEGTDAEGKVVAVNSAGVVVELQKGVEGLIPKAVDSKLNVGDQIKVQVEKTVQQDRQFYLTIPGKKSGAHTNDDTVPEGAVNE
ncbi:MAG: 30S ribosomal protein S1 [Deltaproteobacteria bacterium RIFCSPLOWO2_02_FULL_44_10]|nr:MAG: 30S ribosomal protein S1 [Deltaproteobacteria bacterium RIFCSPHIGHO2_02_FULL_44_16]OGQ46622.1 MAG: 30S ribosomal protein S1 [Deltaproteobacteria bacterium RIFCSPLOWO2_02_FULL_44_10]